MQSHATHTSTCRTMQHARAHAKPCNTHAPHNAHTAHRTTRRETPTTTNRTHTRTQHMSEWGVGGGMRTTNCVIKAQQDAPQPSAGTDAARVCVSCAWHALVHLPHRSHPRLQEQATR